MQGKIVVITGGTSGIGLELCKIYRDKGATVITISRNGEVSPTHYNCDVSIESQVNETVDKLASIYGKIDVLILSAGFGMSGITELLPTDDFKSLTEVNYYGTLYFIRSALKYMEKGSKIVTLSSAMALFPIPFRAIYGSVKSAVLSLSFSLKMELAPLGIEVTSICPGNIKTNFTANRIKNFQTSDRYGNRFKSATLKNDTKEDKRIKADSCAKEIYSKIKKKKCKPFYIIGAKYKFLYFLSRITPKSWLLKFTAKLYDGEY